MHYDYDDHEPTYIPVSKRKENASSLLHKLSEEGTVLSPLPPISSKQIAKSFWGQAWCKNIASYEDLAYRLDRGRSYLRSGCVVDLHILPQKVLAKVLGNELYEVEIRFAELSEEKWQIFARECSKEIHSVMDLITGKLSDSIMSLITSPDNGLFPDALSLRSSCNCPDYADVCKHVAATLYGIGVRFDEDPHLFFELRGIDPEQLLQEAGRELLANPTPMENTSELESIFGIELG